jgi:two-component system chemotaxis response regulator CheB
MQEPVAINRIVVIGASSGGIEALQTLVSALPADFPAPLCIVQHIAADSPGILDRILTRAGPLKADVPTSGERLQPARIYVAPPDHHLIVEPGRVRLTRGPRENRFRPAIDPLFRSAAQVYGPGAIGVILTGNLDDGTAGLWTVKGLGGIAIVQDPADAQFPSMPANALEYVAVDHRVPLREIPALLVRLTAEPLTAPARRPVPKHVDVEVAIANEENAMDAGLEELGVPSPVACPECHGVLLEMKDSLPIRFRCHTGHAYSAQSLLAAISEAIEDALWNSVRALEEASLAIDKLASHIGAHDPARAVPLLAQAREAHRHSEVVRELVTSRRPLHTA